MRILLLVDFYPPVVGGLERVVADLARTLAGRGHAVAVATLAHDGLARVEDDGPVRVHRLCGLAQRLPFVFRDPARRFAPPAPDPPLGRALAAVARDFRPDVVHANGWILYPYLPVAGRGTPPLVATLHEYGSFCARRDLLRDGTPCDGPGPLKCLRCAMASYGPAKGSAIDGALALGGLLHGRVDRFLAVSGFVAELAARHLPRPRSRRAAPIEVVPSFVGDAVPAYRPPTTRSPLLPPGDFLLFVGALARHKGVDTLLAAHAALPDAPPLVLMGAAVGESALPPGGPPSNARVIRDAPHPLVLEGWARCAIGAAPSRWPEPFGIVAAEALALGRPFVAACAGGLPDIVRHGETGLLVPPGDAPALTGALARLLADPALGARLGAAGRARVLERFTATAVAARLEPIYAAAAAAGHGGPA